MSVLSSTLNFCSKCNKYMSNNQNCIYCDLCSLWFHVKCLDMSLKQFRHLACSDSPYFCHSCIAAELPFVSIENACFDGLFFNMPTSANDGCYPNDLCTQCYKVCKPNQNCILCDNCEIWQHVKCTSLSHNEFLDLSSSHCDFYCNSCFRSMFPFSNLTCIDFRFLFEVKNNDCPSFKTLKNHSSEPDSLFVSPTKVKDDVCADNLSVLSINIRSLNKNFIKLETLLAELQFKPDIITVAETWIDKTKDFLFLLKDYNFINKACAGRAGGAGIFIKANIEFKELNEFEINLENCESKMVEITLSNRKKLVIGSVYRHPGYQFTDFKNCFLSTIDSLNTSKKKFIITGDFNINLLKKSSHIENYKNEMLSSGCTQLVECPTRVSATSKNSLIDHVYTNLDENGILTRTIAHDISDHLPNITFTRLYKPKKQQLKRSLLIRDLKNFDSKEFLSELEARIDDLKMNEDLSCDDCWDLFENTFNTVLDVHAPLRFQTRRESKLKSKPWITKGILVSIKRKRLLYREVLDSKCKTEWAVFKRYRNKLCHIIQLSKNNHYKSEIANCKSNPKKLWQTINEIINLKGKKKKNDIVFENNDGEVVKDNHAISNAFNDFFVNIGTELSNKIPPPMDDYDLNPNSLIKAINCSFFLSPLTCRQVKNYILSLDHTKSTKSSCPAIKFLKLSASIISPFLCKIFNKCIRKGCFPKSLKTAEVVPIFKKGNKAYPSNYRPISLLSPFSKIFERHIYDQLYSFVEKNKMLNNFQFGFRNNSSTEMAITNFFEDVSFELSNKKSTCSIFIDLRKAFDTVDHAILISKLEKYGIRGLPASLIKSYLTNRTQITIVNGIRSHEKNVLCGVPQGSILGPLFFLLYINDLPSSTSFKVKLFADDACLIKSNEDEKALQVEVNNELSKVNDWLKVNKLSLNYEKTNFMIFSNKKTKTDIKIKIDGVFLNKVNSTKYLGVILDDKLNWSSHVSYVHSKLCKASHIISKLRYYVSLSALKMVYYSLVHSHISYCISAWGSAPKSIFHSLVTAQKKIIRLITFSHFQAHAAPLFAKLKILNITDLYHLNLSILLHNFLNNKFTGFLHLNTLESFHSHNTRLSSRNNFFQNSNTSKFSLRSLSSCGLKFWRTIPNEIKSKSLFVFKSKLKQLLLSKYV